MLGKMATIEHLPMVTVFSKVHGIDAMLRTLHPDIPVKFVEARVQKDEPHAGLFKKLSKHEMEVLQEAEILLTDPYTVGTLLYELPNLKWMQITWAGADGIFKQLDRSKPFPTYTMTRFGGVSGIHVRDYVIGQIIAHERNFAEIRESQKKANWSDLLKSCNPKYRALQNLSIGILGVGEIGKEIARACKTLGMIVWGLVRQDLPAEKRCEHVDHYRKMDRLQELLENCDYICNVLPSTQETIGLLNGDVLQPCQAKKSIFINVGRGNIITEESILHALSKGWLSAAILDVFQTEPLPDDSPLWKHPQVTITPHYAAWIKANEAIDVFVENYWRYVNGEDLKHIVSWERGY
ncbi:glyoxylate/hydroxypyruvate reductase A-like [Ptychodera flava]|uniref:glyoxylate/hydroxypyruvate reductase A-like n=1 Tax=Ptychodera flava TaxID=63121 RepID=UPI00396A816D